MTAPVIGISTYAEEARWGPWTLPAALLPLSYSDQISRAGGVPVLLPPVPGSSVGPAASAAAAVRRLDGLVLSGGGDIDPASYGADPHPRTGRIRPDRDEAELALLAEAMAQGVPVLGICRGLQLLNVARGGTLHQHVPELAGHDGHAPAPGTFGSHPVSVAPGSMLAKILGAEETGTHVPSSHHQAVDRLGDGLTATAWAPDGVIEAVELTVDGPGSASGPGGARHAGSAPHAGGAGHAGSAGSSRPHPFTLAVQWHPEAGQDARLFHALIEAARSR